MNRRELLSGMACGVLAGGSALAVAKEAISRPTEWLHKWSPRLPEIAKVQAQIKSQGAQLSKDVLHGLPLASRRDLTSALFSSVRCGRQLPGGAGAAEDKRHPSTRRRLVG